MMSGGDNRDDSGNEIIQININQLLSQLGISQEKWQQEYVTAFSPTYITSDDSDNNDDSK